MGKYIGAVKSFNANKGWGFIECVETQQIYGKDILFQKSELPGHVEKGDQVSFSITQGRNGVLAVEIQFIAEASRKKTESAEDDAGTGNYTGTIKSYNPMKGWGFVECAETQQLYGKDILVLKEQLRGMPVAQGQLVAFSVGQGRKGPLATSLRVLPTAIGALPTTADVLFPARSGSGVKRKAQELDEPRSPSYLGTIKSFNLTRGWGFVECAETQAVYGKDILLLKDELAGASVTPGQRVSFSVSQGRNGPLATDIQILVPAGAAAQLNAHMASATQAMVAYKNFAVPPSVCGSGTHVTGATGRLPRPTKAPDPQEPICGIIKSFDEQNGWGFITGEAILKLYGKDVYVSKVALQGQTVSPGEQVMFKVEMGVKGPMASGITILPNGSFVAEGAPCNPFTGTVKSFNAEKGWGFVTSEETTQLFGKDLFLHKRELGGGEMPEVGDQVQFTVQLSTGGRPEAANVTPLAGHSKRMARAS